MSDNNSGTLKYLEFGYNGDNWDKDDLEVTGKFGIQITISEYPVIWDTKYTYSINYQTTL